MPWQAATIEDVSKILQEDLVRCDAGQLEACSRFRVEPYIAKLERFGLVEAAVIVARRGNEVMYWEDVEEGFNISEISADGTIFERGCNQDELRVAIQRWM